MDKEELIKNLMNGGFSEIEARMHIASYDLKAQEAFEACNCEVI